MRVGGGGVEVVTVMVCCEVAVCWGMPLSVVVNVTVYEPAAVYEWYGVAPVALVPSPKFQLKL